VPRHEAASVADGLRVLRLEEMLSGVLGELRQLDPAQDFRRDLVRLQHQVLTELADALPEDLGVELHALAVDLPTSATRDELRVAQAQLVGWLEGVLNGLRVVMPTPPPEPGDSEEQAGARQ
jgi:hypothetical protein